MKSIFASKTFWLNTISILVGILLLAGAMPELREYAPWIVLAQGALNIILRTITNTGVALGRALHEQPTSNDAQQLLAELAAARAAADRALDRLDETKHEGDHGTH